MQANANNNIKLTPVSEDQVADIIAKEVAASSWPWRSDQLLQSLQQGHHCLACSVGNTIIGYCVLLDAVAAMEILNFVVFKEYQGKGLGTEMLRQVIKFSVKQGADEMWLEVRESNHAGIALYTAAGFQQGEIRDEYYPLGESLREAAIQMQRRIGA